MGSEGKAGLTSAPQVRQVWVARSESHLPPRRSFFLRLCSEVPILEDTLMRILVIGLSRELPLGPADAMELADHLVKRAAAVQADGMASPGDSPCAGLCSPRPCRNPGAGTRLWGTPQSCASAGSWVSGRLGDLLSLHLFLRNFFRSTCLWQ